MPTDSPPPPPPAPPAAEVLTAECVENWAALAQPVTAPGWDGCALGRLELAPAAMSLPARPLVPGTEAFAPEWLAAHHARGARSSLPAMACYFIRDATVSGNGQIWLGERLVTDPDMLPRYLRGLMGLGGTLNQNMLRARRLPEKVVEAPTAVLLGHGIHVYGHFLIEMLFRLKLVEMAMADPGAGTRYLLDQAAPAWLLRILTQDLRIPAEHLVFFDPRRESVLLRRAIVPTHVGGEEQGFHPLAAALANRVVAQLDLPAAPTPRRFFAARRDFHNPASKAKRVCVNEEALIAIAQREHGFEPLALQDLPWPQQVAAFLHAEIVVGPFGSALHTAQFSRPGSRMGVIGFNALVQSNISAMRQTELAYLARGISLRGGFAIDEDAFRMFLAALCANPN